MGPDCEAAVQGLVLCEGKGDWQAPLGHALEQRLLCKTERRAFGECPLHGHGLCCNHRQRYLLDRRTCSRADAAEHADSAHHGGLLKSARATDPALQHRWQRLHLAATGLRDAHHRRSNGSRQHLGHPLLQAQDPQGEHVHAGLHDDRHDVAAWAGMDPWYAFLPVLPHHLRQGARGHAFRRGRTRLLPPSLQGEWDSEQGSHVGHERWRPQATNGCRGQRSCASNSLRAD
mmetsp:Transcript_7510/g.18984  ORF Transcript_7510/g.18984 Transcript_7510/m.18984 type:complete len:231 (+) Transcript_7510:649-1341(+)